MKNSWLIGLLMVLFSSCSINYKSELTTDDFFVSYFDKTEWFEERKQELLAVADDKYNFWFSDDAELQELDPHAYWLMNRMMQMMFEIDTADDAWAWMLAVDESVGMYNTRLGRKIGLPELAMAAIGGLTDKYGAGNQPEMNAGSYVDMVIAHYKALLCYKDMFILIDDYNDETDTDVRLMELHYQEFTHWFDLNNAANGLMTFYTYAGAVYSSLPLDLNGTFQTWSEERLDELKLEEEIHWGMVDGCKPYKCPTPKVSVRKFDKLVGFFKSRTYETVRKEFMALHEGMDDEFFNSRFDNCFNFDKIAEMVRLYEAALTGWRHIREQITELLPPEQQKSYKQITQKMHTRFYNDLLELKVIKY